MKLADFFILDKWMFFGTLNPASGSLILVDLG